MRLLRSDTLEFINFDGDEPSEYAILSHRWYDDHQEVSYQDMCSAVGTQKSGFEKIKKCGEIAKSQCYPYFWVDTCCIDKSSSAELSEAINSMYHWYKNATVCYAFLSDVSVISDFGSQYEFKRSEWFSRGWTLQELIAPKQVEFFSKEWKFLGTKTHLEGAIHEVTGVPKEILQGASPERFSVAERMSWASRRKTKRVEDRAYSLMGLFGVSMPLLYGEKEKAFLRLQEEIMKTSDDQSLFVWKDPELEPEQPVGLLALSPNMFADSKSIYPMKFWHNGEAFTMTNKGLRAHLFLIPYIERLEIYRASLECWVRGSEKCSAAIYLKRLSGQTNEWGAAATAQFTRIRGNYFSIISAKEKLDGEYREIYIRQNPENPGEQLQHSNNSGEKLFRINLTTAPHQYQEAVLSMRVIPPQNWDPQTRIFSCVAASGKLGALCFNATNPMYIAIFGLTDDDPWIEVQKCISFGIAWDEFQPRSNLSEWSQYRSDGTIPNVFRAYIDSSNMYASSVFVINTRFSLESI